MAWLVGSLTRLRDGQSHVLALALMVVATAFAAVALPRFVGATSDDLLRETLGSAASDVRDVTFIEEGRIGALFDEPFAEVDAARDRFLVDVPEGLIAVLEPPSRSSIRRAGSSSAPCRRRPPYGCGSSRAWTRTSK